MMYRTVTVTPTLTSNITVNPTLEGQRISVSPYLFGEIDVTATLAGSLIGATAELSDALVDVSVDFYSSVRTYGGEVEFYRGDYEYTPTQNTQTVEINGLLATQNITINPIPSNYGLITWNGSTLTVS